MPKRRAPLDWMDVNSQEFATWAASYLSARRLINPAYTNPSQALRAFQTDFIGRQAVDAASDAYNEKLARNLKQAWVKHLKRKAAKGKQKPYSFEMDVRVHDKLKSIAKSLGQPIYQTLEALILDAGEVQNEIRQQGKERAERLKSKQHSQSSLIERQARQIQALAALATEWERETEQFATDKAKLWLVISAPNASVRPLSSNEANEAAKLQQTWHLLARKRVETNLGILRSYLPRRISAHKPVDSSHPNSKDGNS